MSTATLRFLLALAVLSGASHAQVSLVDVTAAKGLDVIDSVPGDGHAPGAVFTDLNNDGYADVYIMGGRDWGAQQALANRLFLNVPGGNGRTFQEVPGAAGAGSVGEHNGALSADYDNDGDQDLYVINWYNQDDPASSMAHDKNHLYRNNLVETGQLSFTDVTDSTDPSPTRNDEQHGVGWATLGGQSVNQSLTAAWGDPDRDGDLDLYVGTHHGWAGWGGGTPGQRDTFYRNNGNGTFTDITMPSGVTGFETASGAYVVPGAQNYSSSNAVIFADFNNDRWPDLFVSNKIGGSVDRDMLYINQGADAEGNWQGYESVTYTLPTTFGNRTGAAMGVAAGDIDNDGDVDIYMTDWSNPDNFPSDGSSHLPNGPNDLWINQLSDSGQLNFIHSSELGSIFSWGTQFVDFDNNGFLDVHVATDYGVRDSLYLNSASGFSGEVAQQSGFSETQTGRGSVTADYNRDGFVDLLVINPWTLGESVLYEYQTAELGDNGFLVVKLKGNSKLPGILKSSSDAIGARVNVTADLDGDGSIETNEFLLREVVSGSSNAASTSSLDLEFGIGLAELAIVEVLWPSGRITTMTVDADQFVAFQEILADANSDGVVDGVDAASWQAAYGTSSGSAPSNGDADFDGDIDGDDWLHLQRSMGATALVASSASASAVPEPALLRLVAAACPWMALAALQRNARMRWRW
ncbi:CRTAC1 family protein [Pirellulales bacterium]|nr:CRTAC1 family protein [Pirellulales bacterium]